MKKKLTETIQCFGFQKKISKILLLMKLVTFFLILGTLASSATSYSQAMKFDLRMKNSTVEEILQTIESSSEFIFIYDADLIKSLEKISITVRASTIEEILSKLFEDMSVEYLIDDRQVFLYEKEQKIETNSPSVENIVLQQPRMRDITGKVTDSDGLPLIGVSIVVKGSTIGTITDALGNFTITVPSDAQFMVFSYVGKLTQEVSIVDRTIIEIILIEETLGFEELVVVGYGTQRKVNVTGAVSSVGSEVLESRPIANIAQGLQGIIPNLNITQSTGAPGLGSDFNIRGFTSINGGDPLILIDNVPMDINLINPNDIESISVLKDASSAAIYGARAAFGVILITTKSGKKSGQPKVNLSMNYSINKPTAVFQEMDVLERMNYMNAASSYHSGTYYSSFTERYQEKILANYYDPSQPDAFIDSLNPKQWLMCANTNWTDVLFRDSYPQQNYNASLSGGTERFTYYSSLSYYQQIGIPKNFDEKYNRYNFNANLKYNLTDWAVIGSKISVINSDKIYPADVETDAYAESMLSFNPNTYSNYAVYWPDGNYASNGSVMNMVQLHKEGGYRTRDINDVWLTGSLRLTPIKNMSLNIDYSSGFKNRENMGYYKLLPMYYADGSISGYYPGTMPSKVTRTFRKDLTHTFNAYADYENTFSERHFFKVLLGFNQELYTYHTFTASRDNLIVETLPSMDLAYGEKAVEDATAHYAIRGSFGRLNYIFDNRYFFEFNGRYDGTSKFPKDDRFKFFPSASLGWRLDNEPYLAVLKSAFDMLKLRLSYGSLGNQNVTSYYPYIASYSSAEVLYLLGGEKPMTVIAPGLVSPTLTWETVTQSNVGVDLAMLNNRLSASVDFYRRDTKDMLTKSVTLPAVLAVSEPNTNAADLRTTGFDLSVMWKQRTDQVKWSVQILLSDNTSTITKFSNPVGLISNYYVGKNIGDIWGLVTGGIFQTDSAAATLNQNNIATRQRGAGDLYFVDLNGDSVISKGLSTLDDPGDQKIIGNNTPRYSYGLISEVEWKGFDLKIFFQGIAKRDLVLNENLWIKIYRDEWNSINKILTDWWSPEDPDAFFPRPLYKDGTDVTAVQTRFLQNAAYLRLKQLTLGYTIPKSLTQKIMMERIKVYFSGNNLWEINNIIGKIADPETTGADAYPIYRSYSFGVNINF